MKPAPAPQKPKKYPSSDSCLRCQQEIDPAQLQNQILVTTTEAYRLNLCADCNNALRDPLTGSNAAQRLLSLTTDAGIPNEMDTIFNNPQTSIFITGTPLTLTDPEKAAKTMLIPASIPQYGP